MSGTAHVNVGKKTQLEDPDIGPVMPAKVAGIETNSHEIVAKSSTCRHYRVLRDELVLHCEMEKNGTDNFFMFLKLFITPALKRESSYQMPNSLHIGHLGYKRQK